MSLDFILLNAAGVAPGQQDVPEGWAARPMGSAGEVRNAIERVLRGIDWNGSSKGAFSGEGVHLQVGIHGDAEVSSVGVTVHGFGNFAVLIAELCRMNDWVAFDDASEGLFQNRDISF